MPEAMLPGAGTRRSGTSATTSPSDECSLNSNDTNYADPVEITLLSKLLEDARGAGVGDASTHVHVGCHGGSRVSELIGCLASGEAGFVHESRYRLAQRVGGHPFEARGSKCFSEIGLGVGGVA